MDSPPPSDGAESLSQVLIQMDAMLTPMIEVTVGKRKQFIELGFNESDASQMAADYYRTVMAFLRVKSFGANG